MLNPGDIAPRFALPDADMETFDLADAIGRQNVVLYFYPRDNTPGCTRQACDFTDHEMDFLRHDCIVLGVSPDDCLTHAEFRDEHGLSVRLLSDVDAEVCRAYHAWHEREIGGVRKAGVLRSTFVIDKAGTIRHVFYDVSPRGHAAEILELVKQLESLHAQPNRQEHRRHA